MTHFCRTIRTPVCVIVRCNCGWATQITRNQNALARAAKVRSAISRHEREAKAFDDKRRKEDKHDLRGDA